MRQISIREYDYLICAGDGIVDSTGGSRWAKAVPESAFAYLERLMSGEENRDHADDVSFYLKRTTWNRKHAFQMQSFVGVLQTPCGTQIEILPKTADESGQGYKSRAVLITMLRYLRDARFNLGGDAHLRKAPMHLLDLFSTYFLQEVNTLVKKGIRSEYVAKEENQPFLKGKLLINQHIRANAVQQQRFFVSFDEYLPDRPENRLIHKALAKILRLNISPDNQRLCRELAFVFEGVPESKDVRKDFGQCKFNRAMIHYQHALEWCRLILNEESTVPHAGLTKSISILFPMEKVFEDYVAAMLRRYLSSDYRIETQGSGKHLCETPKAFRLRPDIVIRNPNSNECWIADTKWKLLDNQGLKRGISQGDMYQLYAYGKKYDQCKGLFLIYPETDEFNESHEEKAKYQYETELSLSCLAFKCDTVASNSKESGPAKFASRLEAKLSEY